MALVPVVVEQTGRGERSYDIFSRLLKKLTFLAFLLNGANYDTIFHLAFHIYFYRGLHNIS